MYDLGSQLLKVNESVGVVLVKLLNNAVKLINTLPCFDIPFVFCVSIRFYVCNYSFVRFNFIFQRCSYFFRFLLKNPFQKYKNLLYYNIEYL